MNLLTLIISVGLTVFTLWTGSAIRESDRRRSEEKTKMEIANHFTDTFYDIEKDKNSKGLNYYYDRLYGLHSIEFLFYKKRLLDKDVYVSWLQFRNRLYQKSLQDKGWLAQSIEMKQWHRVRKTHTTHPLFVEFMNEVLDVQDDSGWNKIRARLDVLHKTPMED